MTSKEGAKDSLREALRRLHVAASKVRDRSLSNELHNAAHDIGQAVYDLGDYLPQSPEEAARFRRCPVCGAVAGQPCINVPGHTLPPATGNELPYHLERVG